MTKKLNIFLMLIAFAFFSCQENTGDAQTKGSASAANTNNGKEITILYSNWASAITITHLAKVALEDHGYKTKIIVENDLEVIYKSLSQGETDLLLECWLPYTSVTYWNKYQNNLEKLGVGYAGGSTGIVVPDYVEEQTIEDLTAARDKYESIIWGIGNSSGIHSHTEKAISAYNLPFVQATTSDIVMTAALTNAIKQRKAIAVTGWKPHYMWSEFKIRYLNDPKQIFPVDKSYIIARKGFSNENPELGKFFKNFFIADKELYDLMDVLDKADDDLEATRKWYQKNKEYVSKMWK